MGLLRRDRCGRNSRSRRRPQRVDGLAHQNKSWRNHLGLLYGLSDQPRGVEGDRMVVMIAPRDKQVPRIGTAGWSVPSTAAGRFGKQGSQLQRYGAYFSCVEINSSFYRPHRVETYERWAATVSSSFRFAVKAPRSVTHEAKLRDTYPLLRNFFEQVLALGAALGPILVQLPPSLKFDRVLMDTFLGDLRAQFAGQVVLEPRHPTWFGEEAEELLRAHSVGRVAADPSCYPSGATPGGWAGPRYWRLHGSPRMYFSPYGEDRLRPLVELLSPDDWCIFDNTASGAALTDALLLRSLFQF
jgi:uncharacterized protein YecE (DUF72 family)